MFETLRARAEQLAARRAAARRERLAARVAEGAPAGVRVAVDGKDVLLAGRGMTRRETELRWLVREVLDE